MIYSGFHKEFPRLFQPAFNLQINMTRYVMGERFWNKKKREIQKMKAEQKQRVCYRKSFISII